MKHPYIKYEKLSNEIKHEISDYFRIISAEKSEATFDESLAEWFNLKFDEWLIKRFGKIKKGSRRRHFRLDVEISVSVIDTLIESSKDDTNAREFVGKIINISRGGLYFIYHAPIEISSIIKVLIHLSETDKELSDIEALAMVIRSDKIKNDSYGIGIMFSSIYGFDKESLDLFILKNLSFYMYSE